MEIRFSIYSRVRAASSTGRYKNDVTLELNKFHQEFHFIDNPNANLIADKFSYSYSCIYRTLQKQHNLEFNQVQERNGCY